MKFCTGDNNYITVASEFQFDNLIRSIVTLVFIKILCHLGKIGRFWGYFWPNMVIFTAFFREFFRDPFFAKNFSSNHFSFLAKNEKFCNTSWKPWLGLYWLISYAKEVEEKETPRCKSCQITFLSFLTAFSEMWIVQSNFKQCQKSWRLCQFFQTFRLMKPRIGTYQDHIASR